MLGGAGGRGRQGPTLTPANPAGCQATLQNPIKPTSTKTTGTLGSQILVTVTLAGAVPCRPQAASLQTYPASSKAGAEVPHTRKGRVI